jgi:hypothetical protein
MAAGDQSPLPPSVASSAIDHPPGRVIFCFFLTTLQYVVDSAQVFAAEKTYVFNTAMKVSDLWSRCLKSLRFINTSTPFIEREPGLNKQYSLFIRPPHTLVFNEL